MKLITERVNPKELPVLSASSLNMFMKDPALWVLKHFYGAKSGENIYASRGKLIEAAITAKTPEEEAKAWEEYHTSVFQFEDDDLSKSIEDNLPWWISEGKSALKYLEFDHGDYVAQTEVKGEIEGLPFIGYIDLRFKNFDVDIKTSNKLPSIVSRGARKGRLPADKRDNVRQQLVYQMITNRPQSLLYLSPEGHYLHRVDLEEYKELHGELIVNVNAIKKLLSMDIDDILANTIPKWNQMRHSIYWDDQLRDLAVELWGDYEL